MRRFDVFWKNFRSFEDTGWLKVKPLTVIIGANASGKTSAMAPLLMLKQTLESTDTSLPLRSQGRYFNAGTFPTFVFAHALEREVTLGLRFRIPKRVPDKLLPVGRYSPGLLELVFEVGENHEATQLKSYELKDIYDRPMVRRVRHADGTYGADLFAPAKAGSEFDRVLRQSKPSHFLFTAEGMFRVRYEEAKTRTKQQPAARRAKQVNVNLDEQEVEYISAISFAQTGVSALLNSLAYIGPLRERPKRLYELSGERPQSVGSRGQFAPEILFRGRDSDLAGAVDVWLKRFDFGFKIRAKERTKGAFEVILRRSSGSPWVSLADTGFGLSQVLPLIVQGLYMEKGGMMVAEQPEIHLNPRLQSMLADLFVDIVRRGAGVLVETHSEHLLLRLRRLIAQGTIKAQEVGIYYAERTKDTSVLRPIPVSEVGHIELSDWPKGFFDDALKEAFSLAAAQSQAKKNAR